MKHRDDGSPISHGWYVDDMRDDMDEFAWPDSPTDADAPTPAEFCARDHADAQADGAGQGEVS